MHIIDSVVHDSCRDALASKAQRPRGLHVQIKLRYSTSLTSIVLRTQQPTTDQFTWRKMIKQLIAALVTSALVQPCSNRIEYRPTVGQKNAPVYCCNNFVKTHSGLINFGAYILQQICYHLCIVHFTFFVKWKTENQRKICLVHLLADVYACIDRSFCDYFTKFSQI